MRPASCTGGAAWCLLKHITQHTRAPAASVSGSAAARVSACRRRSRPISSPRPASAASSAGSSTFGSQLAAHLGLAVAIYGYIVWLALGLLAMLLSDKMGVQVNSGGNGNGSAQVSLVGAKSLVANPHASGKVNRSGIGAVLSFTPAGGLAAGDVQAALVDDDHLAGLELAHVLGLDEVQRRRLAGQHPAAADRVDDAADIVGVLFEEHAECLTEYGSSRTLSFSRTKLGLGLPFKLNFSQLYRDNHSKPLEYIVP